MKTLVFASNNAHKLEEIRSILAGSYDIRSLSDIGCKAEIPETGSTFAENAMQKASYVKEHFGYDCFADDSGLQVEALGGEPGVYSARFAMKNGVKVEGNKDDANMNVLLDKMANEENRKACFRTCVALIYEGEKHFFDGTVEGHIIHEKRGNGGFGYDPLFIPDGYDKTFAELGTEVKNGISHRARAVAKLADFLKSKEMKILSYLLLIPLFLVGCKRDKVVEEAYVSPAPEFCEDSAFQYVAEQCDFGPRVMNSAAHDSCGSYIANRFRQFGATVVEQKADSRLYDGTPIRMCNIIASYNSKATARIIVCGHWDSRPWADHDSDETKHHTPIDGANDGASSVGVMLELARQLQLDMTTHGDSALLAQHPNFGIDLICWDAEDCGTPSWVDDGESHESTWCLGSQYWAGNRHVEGYTARYAVNLDMVGNANTIFYREGYSLRYAPTVVDRVWGAAQRIGYGSLFSFDDNGGYVTDDHVQVNQGGIPCIDVIGTDSREGGFPVTWHTTDDNIKNINKETLKAVGQTMLEVIWTEP